MTKEELIHEIALALEDGSIRHYLDLQTLHVVNIPEVSMDFDEDWDKIRANPKHYLLIDKVPSQRLLEMMTDFAKTIKNEDFRHRLLDALDGSRAFNDFWQLVMQQHEYQQQWYAFKDEFYHEEALTWLLEKLAPGE